MAVALEATYQGVLTKAAARGMTPIEREPFWLILAARLRNGANPAAMHFLLAADGALQEMIAWSLARRSHSISTEHYYEPSTPTAPPVDVEARRDAVGRGRRLTAPLTTARGNLQATGDT